MTSSTWIVEIDDRCLLLTRQKQPSTIWKSQLPSKSRRLIINPAIKNADNTPNIHTSSRRHTSRMNEDDRARAEDCGADDGQANTSFQTVRRPACAYLRCVIIIPPPKFGFSPRHNRAKPRQRCFLLMEVIVVKCLLQVHLKKCIRSPHISPAASNLPRPQTDASSSQLQRATSSRR